jgi:hypothetical protein
MTKRKQDQGYEDQCQTKTTYQDKGHQLGRKRGVHLARKHCEY